MKSRWEGSSQTWNLMTVALMKAKTDPETGSAPERPFPFSIHDTNRPEQRWRRRRCGASAEFLNLISNFLF